MFRYAVPAGADTRALVVASAGLALVVDAPDPGSAERLWAAVSAPGARLEDVLTVLVSQGLRRTPDFALLEVADPDRGAVTVAVRGAGRASLGPGRAVSGRGAATWLEASHEGVTEAELALGDDAPGAELLPLAEGVGRAGVARWTPADTREPQLPPEHARTPEPEPEHARTPEPEPEHLTQPTVDLDLSDEETILGSLRRGARSGDPAESGRSRPERPEPAGSPDPAPRGAAGADPEATVIGSRRVPRTPGHALAFDTGRIIRLGETPVVVGRAAGPATPVDARWESLPSPTREVSGTHAELRLTHGILLVTDLGSTNGTVIAAQGTPPFVLRGGASAHLAPGDRIDFGDGNAAVFRTDA